MKRWRLITRKMEGNGMRQAIHITLRGKYNITYSGTLVLHGNVTSRLGMSDDVTYNRTFGEEEKYDATGASYYVIAVVLVYGMSIVALIASHIKKRHEKMTEDKQIDKYLQDFQIIKEVHARDSYKNLKRSVMNKINLDRKKETHRTLQQSILPLLAIGMQVGSSRNSSSESISDTNAPGKGKRKVYPIGGHNKRHSDPDLSDCSKLLAEVNAENRPRRGRRHSHMDQPPCYQPTDSSMHGLNLLSLPDPHHLFLLAPGSTPIGNHANVIVGVGAGAGAATAAATAASNVAAGSDTANSRRLRFSSSVSQLDRSLNSIAEGEEQEEREGPLLAPNATPASSRPSSRASSRCLLSPESSLETPAEGKVVSKVNMLRRIGVSLAPNMDRPPLDVTTSSYSSEQEVFDDDIIQAEEIRIPVDAVWNTREYGNGGDERREDPDGAATLPPLLRGASHPVSIMVEVEEDDDNDEDTHDRLVPVIHGSVGGVVEEEEDERLTPGGLLATIKYSGRTLGTHGPRRHLGRRSKSVSRSPSCSPSVSRRASYDDRRSMSMSMGSRDGSMDMVDDSHPLQITCL